MTDTRKDLKKTQDEKEIPLREIHHLAFSGGGWRTLYAQGVIEGLHEAGILQNVVSASFCSGSCVPAVFLLSGYTPEQSMQFLKEHVLDDKYTSSLYFIPEHIDSEKSPYYLFGKPDGFLKRMTKYIANAGIFSYLFMKNVFDAVRSKGIFHTKSLEELLWSIIKNSPTLPPHLRKRNITFLELYQYKAEFQTRHHHLPFINPYISVAEKTSEGYKVRYHSYETTPHESILKAACASMTIPGIFRQVEKGLLDGGLVDSSARSAFDTEEKMNMRTQAVYFAPSQTDIERWRDNRPKTKLLSSTSWFMKKLGLEKYWNAQEEAHQVGANSLRTLYIDSSSISTLRPKGLSTEKFNKICHDTKNQTKEYLNLYFFNTPCPHASLDKVPRELHGYYK